MYKYNLCKLLSIIPSSPPTMVKSKNNLPIFSIVSDCVHFYLATFLASCKHLYTSFMLSPSLHRNDQPPSPVRQSSPSLPPLHPEGKWMKMEHADGTHSFLEPSEKLLRAALRRPRRWSIGDRYSESVSIHLRI